MPPPRMFNLSRLIPRCLADGRTCAAKASLISTRSMSSMVNPARCSAWRHASIGPRPMISGFRPLTPLETIRAKGLRPSSFARVSLMTITAAAPSLRGQALPAVTEPPSRKTGSNDDSFSNVVPARGPSSFEITVPSARVTGIISRSKKPLVWWATASSWLRTANSSISRRETCSCSATFSAVWPMAM